MSSDGDTTATTGAPLSEVMLAMDVVDTLRHQQAWIESALDEDERERALIARVREIYESQGIDVTDEVIARGVAALREDRFTYEPPERTLQVRLAEMYVDRVKWMLGAGVLLLIGALIWAAVTIPGEIERRSMVAAFIDRVEQTERETRALQARAAELRAQVERADDEGPGIARQVLAGARERLGAASDGLAAVREELAAGVDAERYPDERARLDATADGWQRALRAAGVDLGAVQGNLQGLAALRDVRSQLAAFDQRLAAAPEADALREELTPQRALVVRALDDGAPDLARDRLQELVGRLDDHLGALRALATGRARHARLQARLDGMQIEAAARAEVDDLSARAQRALEARDATAAENALSAFERLVDTLDASYELRIVTAPGEQSGVWRYPEGRRDARNYYIVVEPIGPDGRAVALPVLSEETQRTSVVRRFAIRVPQRVYEAVRDDKLDNGIVDQRVFGTKRRGAKEPDYRFDVAGGAITSW